MNSESVILTQEKQEPEPREQDSNGFQFWPFFPVHRKNDKTRQAAGFWPGEWRLAVARTVNAAVVVVVVLTVVLLAVNAGALPVLRLMQVGALATCHNAVGLGAVFHIVDTLLATVEAVGFALGQAAGSDTLIDALLLIGLTLVDARRVGLGEGKCRQNKGKDSDGLDDFHVVSPGV
jgi:hypothetical protein